MERDPIQLEALLPNIAAQMRGALSNLHLAAAQLVPAAQREQDPDLDARALCWTKATISFCVWQETSPLQPCSKAMLRFPFRTEILWR